MKESMHGKFTHCCGTCSYFVGDRNPMPGGFVKIRNENGKCYLLLPSGIPKNYFSSCSSWKMWDLLK